MGYSKENIMPNEAKGKYNWICIPATESKKQSFIGEIPESFTDASSFYIVDVKKEVFNTIPANQLASMFKDNNALQSSGISHIITKSVSFLAQKILTENNIKLLQAESNDVFDNIMLMKTNKLKPIDATETRANSACNGKCGECNSSSCSN